MNDMFGTNRYSAPSGLQIPRWVTPRAMPWAITFHRVAVIILPAPKKHHAIATVNPAHLKSRNVVTQGNAVSFRKLVSSISSAPKGHHAIAQGNALGMLGNVYSALKGRHACGFLALLMSLCFVMGCRQETKEVPRKLEFDAFVPVYNRYIETWLKTQQAETEKEIAKVTTDLATAEGDAKAALKTKANALQKDQEKWNFRLGLGPYLKFSNPSEIPTDLVWENGMDQPEIGDPRAKKGGVLRTYMADFPPTIRPIGLNSNNGSRSELYDNNELLLITYHRETMELMPGIASEWAVSKDKRTVYFKIDPDARYSDGRPIKASDYLLTTYIYCSDYSGEPFQKQYFRESFAQFVAYDDKTLSISMSEPNFFVPIMAGWAWPSHPGFYSEYGPDYSERYQWRFAPTTGAYEVRPEDMVKGVSITQTRVRNWWAKDKKFYRYRFNPDKIIHTVVRDPSKAFELFRAGEIDVHPLTRPELWYEKSEIPPVHDGYIERATFYNKYPSPDRGLYLNVLKSPLGDKNIRIGIQYAMNWDKVNKVLFRGDYKRKNALDEGYGIFSDPSITARPYSIELSRKAFRDAGYTEDDRDGIFKKPDGKRLEIGVNYPAIPDLERIFAILREEAKACGFDLRLDGSEPTNSYKKQMDKQHQIGFAAFLGSPPVPDPYQMLHSTTAVDEKGNPKVQTNNLFGWARKDTDFLSEKVRTASTAEEIKDAAWKLQNIVHEEAFFVPAYTVDFIRMGSWRWVRWPDSPNTRFSPPIVDDPLEAHVLWIDQDIQKETQAARRSGKTFPESNRIFDDYREKPALKEEVVKP